MARIWVDRAPLGGAPLATIGTTFTGIDVVFDIRLTHGPETDTALSTRGAILELMADSLGAWYAALNALGAIHRSWWESALRPAEQKWSVRHISDLLVKAQIMTPGNLAEETVGYLIETLDVAPSGGMSAWVYERPPFESASK